MLPLRDSIPSRSAPVVNYILITICAIVFGMQILQPDDPMLPTLTERYGMIPARVNNPDKPVEMLVGYQLKTTPDGIPIVHPDGKPVTEPIYRNAAPSSVTPVLTMLTCVFLHGGWLHFLGNMWFLWVFGDNVEDRLGHWIYLAFYLLGGAGASYSHYVTDMSSTVPTLGASGAIAAVMGAYMVLYPRSRVLTLIPIFIFIQLVWLPAPLFLGIWFIIQLVQGVGSVTVAASTGVAWWAHIGGFAFGAAVAWAMEAVHIDRPAVEKIRPGSDRFPFFQRKKNHAPPRFERREF